MQTCTAGRSYYTALNFDTLIEWLALLYEHRPILTYYRFPLPTDSYG